MGSIYSDISTTDLGIKMVVLGFMYQDQEGQLTDLIVFSIPSVSQVTKLKIRLQLNHNPGTSTSNKSS
jgi:hypothetical protein